MSLDVHLIDPTSTYSTDDLFWANITHNLGAMAEEAGIYKALWRPHRLNPEYNIPDGDYAAESDFEDFVTVKAKDIIEIIELGLNDMKARPDHFKKFNAENGWGTYKQFVPWIEEYLEALKKFPESIVKISR